MSAITKKLAEVLSQRKCELNLRIEDLAKLTGTSTTTISTVLADKANPTMYCVESLLAPIGYELKIVPSEKLKQEQEQRRLRATFYRE